MKALFARIVLISGFYDFLLAALFIFGGPVLSLFLGIPLDSLSATLLQILGGCLFAFGIALIVASRNLDQLLIIPVINLLARLIGFVVVIYYVFIWALPLSLTVFGIIDAIFGLVFLAFILVIKEYSFRAALTGRQK
jgi:hypothetical protein